MVRFEKTWILTYNDRSWYDYYGQGMFTSVGYESMAKLNIRLGMPGNHINSYHYKDNTLYMIYYLILDIIWVILEIIALCEFMKKMECIHTKLNLTLI